MYDENSFIINSNKCYLISDSIYLFQLIPIEKSLIDVCTETDILKHFGLSNIYAILKFTVY